MQRRIRRHGRVVDPATGRRLPTAEEMVHPAVRGAASAASADIPVEDFADHDSLVASWQAGTAAPEPPAAGPAWGDMAYDQGTGERATPIIQGRAQENLDRRARVAAVPRYQRSGRDSLQGYVSNPLEVSGRRAMGRQFWEAPLGGHVRSFAEGMGLEANHAQMAEQGLAGLTAVGIGVPAFMAAVQQLTTPTDQNTIPL